MFPPGRPCCVPWVPCVFMAQRGWVAPLWVLQWDLARKKYPFQVKQWGFNFRFCCIFEGDDTWETPGPSCRSLEKWYPLVSSARPDRAGAPCLILLPHSSLPAGLGSLLWSLLLKQTYFDKSCLWQPAFSDSTSHGDSCLLSSACFDNVCGEPPGKSLLAAISTF